MFTSTKVKEDNCSDFFVVISLHRYIVHLEVAAAGISNFAMYNNHLQQADQ